jgi:Holliday junction resolvase-like predicted endonuclease
VQELDDYITAKKVWHLQRTLNQYLRQTNESQFNEIRMDAVFVQHWEIIEIYQDITNT